MLQTDKPSQNLIYLRFFFCNLDLFNCSINHIFLSRKAVHTHKLHLVHTFHKTRIVSRTNSTQKYIYLHLYIVIYSNVHRCEHYIINKIIMLYFLNQTSNRFTFFYFSSLTKKATKKTMVGSK
jgi:hypothetical protein